MATEQPTHSRLDDGQRARLGDCLRKDGPSLTNRVLERLISAVEAIGQHLPMLVFVLLATDAAEAQAEEVSSLSDQSYDWKGFYFGGHLGTAWGSSSWSAGPGISGSSALFQPIDHFDEDGSWFTGVQGGYNYVLPNHLLLGAEADFSAPSYPKLPTGVNPFGLSIGDSFTFGSPALGAVSFAESPLMSGTVRGRVGYALGGWPGESLERAHVSRFPG